MKIEVIHAAFEDLAETVAEVEYVGKIAGQLSDGNGDNFPIQALSLIHNCS